jgi:hypothetical protein
MTIPAFLFGGLMATLYGAAFHLWKGGNLGRLIQFLFFSWLGFWLGHFIGSRLHWTFGNLGPLCLGLATLGSIVFLLGGHFLSLIEVEDRRKVKQ